MSKKIITILVCSVALVVILGLVMLGGGLNLLGITLIGTGNKAPHIAQINGNMQIVSIDVKPDGYTPIVVQKGIPVRFILKAEASDLSGCNSTVVTPSYNITKNLNPGETIIEFIPQAAGKIPYACSMGMKKSYIRVVEDISKR